MSGEVWMSSLKSNSQLGDKQGLRTKFFGEEWEPASFILPVMSDATLANMKRSARGYALQREELPEAAAIWNEKSFAKKRRDILGRWLPCGQRKVGRNTFTLRSWRRRVDPIPDL